jgi:hypothetical protein
MMVGVDGVTGDDEGTVPLGVAVGLLNQSNNIIK